MPTEILRRWFDWSKSGRDRRQLRVVCRISDGYFPGWVKLEKGVYVHVGPRSSKPNSRNEEGHAVSTVYQEPAEEVPNYRKRVIYPGSQEKMLGSGLVARWAPAKDKNSL